MYTLDLVFIMPPLFAKPPAVNYDHFLKASDEHE